MWKTHVFHAQVQDLSALSVRCSRIRIRHIVAADDATKRPCWVSHQLDEWCEESAMTLALPDDSRGTLLPASARVQPGAASCQNRVGQQGHGDGVHAMRCCCEG